MSNDGRFCVFNTGHAGSSWAGMVFGRLGVRAFHEPLVNLLDARSRRAIAEGVTGGARDAALERWDAWRARRLAESPVLGEIHTTGIQLWPNLLDRLAGRRALLTRDPVQVVQSMASGDVEESVRALRGYGQLASDVDISTLEAARQSLFSIACDHWAAQAALLESLAPIRLFRLEDVTTDPVALADFVRHLVGVEPDPEICAALGAEVVNRKVRGERTPGNIFWSWWDDALRERFVARCGDAMARLGYALPERPGAPTPPPPEGQRVDRRPPPPESLRPMWVFSSEQRPGDVLVLGEGEPARYAALALTRERSWLVDSSETPWPHPPRGCQVIGIDDVGLIPVRGVFVVGEPTEALERVLLRFPDTEVVRAFDPDEDERWDVDDATRGPGLRFRASLGGIRVGDELDSGWAVRDIRVDPASLTVGLSVPGHELTARCTPGAAHVGPVRLLDSSLTHDRTTAAPDSVVAALESLARRLENDAPATSAREAIAAWARAR